MEKVKYYRFDVGSVVIRQTGDLIEKKGKSGVWEEAPQLRRRILYGDTDVIEISKEEAERLAGEEL
jgi:hypothetical protein